MKLMNSLKILLSVGILALGVAAYGQNDSTTGTTGTTPEQDTSAGAAVNTPTTNDAATTTESNTTVVKKHVHKHHRTPGSNTGASGSKSGHMDSGGTTDTDKGETKY